MAVGLNQKEFRYVIDAMTETRNRMHARLDGENDEDKRWDLEENIFLYDYLIKKFQKEQEEEYARSLSDAAKQFDMEQVKKDLKKEFGE